MKIVDKVKAKHIQEFTKCFNVNRVGQCAFCNKYMVVRTLEELYNTGYRAILDQHDTPMACCGQCLPRLNARVYRLPG